ncbi:C-X-C motif chemokine 6-like [Morone saxatilis]|uniref:C-X-C motif chemokine 6-like n=1 Tax=Morone saxatilis TaxID=34816 RepID=UPI0015E245B3|nr:C-X-C motif chemokine 6-like [Morone saxatilis]
MSFITIVALMVFLTIPEVFSSNQEVIRCRCITTEKRRIGRFIGQVEVNPATSHCNDIEIIATLKSNGEKICLDPNAPWVKRVLEKKLVVQAP